MMSTPLTRTSSTPRSELERAAWPELEPSIFQSLLDAGEARHFEPGDVLFEVGQDSYDFTYLVRGAVDIVDRSGDLVIVTVEAPNFLGELGMLMGQGTFLAGVAKQPTEAVVVSQETLRELIASVPELSDIVVTAYAARRRLLIEWGEGGLTIIGDERDPDCLRLREFASRNRLPHRFVDRADRSAVDALAASTELPASGTAVITGRSEVLARPTTRDVAKALRLELDVEKDELYDLVVVGAGPGGLAAAVFGASEGLCCLIIEDTAIGGQAGTSSRIENYLGFSTGISGTDLAYQGVIQAVKFGARIAMPRRAIGLERAGEGFVVELDDGSRARTRAVILAAGVQYRRLPLDRLEQLEGAGAYYAATQLEARFCVGQDAVVVGGGNSAGQAAMFLSRHARRTHIVVRGEGLTATMSSYLSERIHNDPRIRLWTKTEVSELHGEGRLSAVTLRQRESGDATHLPAGALFIMIGAAPNTEWLRGFVELDDQGFITTGRAGDPFVTSQPGIYAVGDIRSGSVKRVASAVGEGSVVISAVHRHLAAAQDSLRRVDPVD